jgi:hypothetical protein
MRSWGSARKVRLYSARQQGAQRVLGGEYMVVNKTAKKSIKRSVRKVNLERTAVDGWTFWYDAAPPN